MYPPFKTPMQVTNVIIFRSFGTVHKARHKDSNFIIAIKIVDIDMNNDEATSIKREIDILKVCTVKLYLYLIYYVIVWDVTLSSYWWFARMLYHQSVYNLCCLLRVHSCWQRERRRAGGLTTFIAEVQER